MLTGWDCSFPNIEDIVWKSSSTLTVKELLHKFFVFYSDSTLIDYVLCTLTGKKVEKKHFVEKYNQLPEPFARFKDLMMERGVLFNQVSKDFKQFCIQDPFNHLNNLTKTIRAAKFARFVKLCEQTTKLFDCWESVEDN